MSFFFYIFIKDNYTLTHTHIQNADLHPFCYGLLWLDNLIYQAKDEGEEDCEVSGELARLLQQQERTIQPHEEPVDTVNLGTEEDKKEVKVCDNLEPNVKKRLIQLLHDYVEVFSWSYKDMPWLDADIVSIVYRQKKTALR